MDQVRKIAANYIYLPTYSLVKNGYVEVSASGGIQVVNTGGQIREIPALEFYGGLIVAGFVCGSDALFVGEESLLRVLDRLYFSSGDIYTRLAIIEGADLRSLTWKTGARIRML